MIDSISEVIEQACNRYNYMLDISHDMAVKIKSQITGMIVLSRKLGFDVNVYYKNDRIVKMGIVANNAVIYITKFEEETHD